MAQKVEVVLTCDLDERSTPAVETVQFTYGGQAYEFELCADHLKEFTEVMQRYASAARPAGRQGAGRGRGGRGGRRATGSELAALRAWAQENGYTVNERGRIPLHVRQAYEAANA
ncbi:MAG: Lsr2 family protein [Acidimicrobiales bacterium]|nr:Lsr2 family protein [Acidimicrobiales bacterium]